VLRGERTTECRTHAKGGGRAGGGEKVDQVFVSSSYFLGVEI
jgi:hypothetical protein